MMSTGQQYSSSTKKVASLTFQDENGNDIPPEEASASALKRELDQLSLDFTAAGEEVKKAVEQRTELFKDFDAVKEKLHALQVEERESGIDDFDEKDPLCFIEGDYQFFQSAEECTPENIINVENPRKCIKAMEKFVKVLQDNLHRFKYMPKGPLFKEVKARNKKWAPLTEYVLRPYLFSFLVDNLVDGLVFQELIDEHFAGAKPGSINAQGVVCPKYHVFSFRSSYMINSRITSISGLEMENMLESLHFIDEVWGKFLSSTISVEKLVFMDNENAAFLVMSHIRRIFAGLLGSSTPWHCKMAYTLDGFRVHPFPCFRTKKIQYHHRPLYLRCTPNSEILDYFLKANRIEKKISLINIEIYDHRALQVELLKQHEKIKSLYIKAKEREAPPDEPKRVKVPKEPKPKRKGRLGRILF